MIIAVLEIMSKVNRLCGDQEDVSVVECVIDMSCNAKGLY